MKEAIEIIHALRTKNQEHSFRFKNPYKILLDCAEPASREEAYDAMDALMELSATAMRLLAEGSLLIRDRLEHKWHVEVWESANQVRNMLRFVPAVPQGDRGAVP